MQQMLSIPTLLDTDQFVSIAATVCLVRHQRQILNFLCHATFTNEVPAVTDADDITVADGKRSSMLQINCPTTVCIMTDTDVCYDHVLSPPTTHFLCSQD